MCITGVSKKKTCFLIDFLIIEFVKHAFYDVFNAIFGFENQHNKKSNNGHDLYRSLHPKRIEKSKIAEQRSKAKRLPSSTSLIHAQFLLLLKYIIKFQQVHKFMRKVVGLSQLTFDFERFCFCFVDTLTEKKTFD